jgi:hypothetical protein
MKLRDEGRRGDKGEEGLHKAGSVKLSYGPS